MIRAQLELIFIAIAFFSRLPVPGWVDFAPDKLGRAARYLPLVGWLWWRFASPFGKLDSLVVRAVLKGRHFLAGKVKRFIQKAYALTHTSSCGPTGPCVQQPVCAVFRWIRTSRCTGG